MNRFTAAQVEAAAEAFAKAPLPSPGADPYAPIIAALEAARAAAPVVDVEKLEGVLSAANEGWTFAHVAYQEGKREHPGSQTKYLAQAVADYLNGGAK